MKLRTIIEVASKVYDVDDTLIRVFEAGASARKLGDTLACFVVDEIKSTYDADASDQDKFKELDRIMTRASQQLASVATAARVEWTGMFDAAQTKKFAEARKAKARKAKKKA